MAQSRKDVFRQSKTRRKGIHILFAGQFFLSDKPEFDKENYPVTPICFCGV